jgi:hypothetical protein
MDVLEKEAKEEERFTSAVAEVPSPLWPVVAIEDVSGGH